MYSPSHLSVVCCPQDLIRAIVPPTSLLHPGREAADGLRLLINREIPAYFAASLYKLSRGHSTIRHLWTRWVAVARRVHTLGAYEAFPPKPSDFPPTTTTNTDDWSTVDKTQTIKHNFTVEYLHF